MPISGKRDPLPSHQTLWSFFEASCLRAPNSLAIIDAEGGQKLTYNQFSSQVNKLSRFLLRLLANTYPATDGKRPIAVCIPPSIDLILCLFAILQIKRAYLPLDVDLPSSRVTYILEDSRPQILITKGHQPALSELRTNHIDNIFLLDLKLSKQEIHSENSASINQDSISSSDVVVVLYTSGSTGIPKGVRIPQTAVVNRLIWQWKTFPYGQNEMCCFKTALTFVDSISEIFGPLLTSHQLVVISKRITNETEMLMKVLEDFRIGRLIFVPSLLRSILLQASRVKNPLPRLKLWISSGETLQPDLLYSFFDIFKNNQQTMCNFYGSTEVMGDVTYIQFNSSEDIISFLYNNKIPIGSPLSNVDIYLVNNNMEEVPDGEVGELLAAGLSLADGYVGQKQTYKFIDNVWNSEPGYSVLYRTGDFARYVNGQLIFEGRIDSQLKIRGHRVDLSEIELTIQRIKGIDKCCVVCHHPGEIDQEIVAFFTSKDKDVTVDKVKSKMIALLSLYMQPKLMKIEEMPFLVNGKVDRQSLLKLFEVKGNKKTLKDAEIDLSNCIEGKEEAAKTLIKILIQILGPSAPPVISLSKSFWEIGGNSLNAVLVITSYQDAGYYVGIKDFLSSETLNDIVNHASKIDQNPFASCDHAHKIHDEKGYKCMPIKDEDKETVRRIVSRSFIYKGDLEAFLDITENEYNNVIDQIFENIMNRNLSFVVSRKDEDEIIAVSINADYSEENEIYYPSKNIKYIFDFIEDCETKVRYCLPESSGKIVHAFMMTTKEDVSPGENVALIQVMEKETLRIAKERSFDAVFTTNTSTLTQHVCDDLMSYKALGTYQFNTWEAEDGVRPFKDAEDNQFAVCSVLFFEDAKGKDL